MYAEDFSIKMMSEDEVKREKQNYHFLKMFYYFEKVLSFSLGACHQSRKIDILSEVWKKHFLGLIHTAYYPSHRMPLRSFLRKTCIAFYNCSSAEFKKESHLFYQYSQFIADFFVMRGAKITPPVAIMEKTEKFLGYALTLELNKYENDFIFLFFNEMSEYILENMEFDINLKKLAVRFFNFCIEKDISSWSSTRIYEWLVKNVNILSSCEGIHQLLLFCAKKVTADQHSSLFDEILSYVPNTKRLILSVMGEIPEYKPEFEDYIKLRILALENSK